MKELYVIQCWEDFGDGESGPMVETWYEIVTAEEVGDAWLEYRGSVRPATEKERAGYEAYQREVQKFKELGIKEEDCPFDIHCFVEFEEV